MSNGARQNRARDLVTLGRELFLANNPNHETNGIASYERTRNVQGATDNDDHLLEMLESPCPSLQSTYVDIFGDSHDLEAATDISSPDRGAASDNDSVLDSSLCESTFSNCAPSPPSQGIEAHGYGTEHKQEIPCSEWKTPSFKRCDRAVARRRLDLDCESPKAKAISEPLKSSSLSSEHHSSLQTVECLEQSPGLSQTEQSSNIHMATEPSSEVSSQSHKPGSSMQSLKCPQKIMPQTPACTAILSSAKGFLPLHHVREAVSTASHSDTSSESGCGSSSHVAMYSPKTPVTEHVALSTEDIPINPVGSEIHQNVHEAAIDNGLPKSPALTAILSSKQGYSTLHRSTEAPVTDPCNNETSSDSGNESCSGLSSDSSKKAVTETGPLSNSKGPVSSDIHQTVQKAPIDSGDCNNPSTQVLNSGHSSITESDLSNIDTSARVQEKDCQDKRNEHPIFITSTPNKNLRLPPTLSFSSISDGYPEDISVNGGSDVSLGEPSGSSHLDRSLHNDTTETVTPHLVNFVGISKPNQPHHTLATNNSKESEHVEDHQVNPLVVTLTAESAENLSSFAMPQDQNLTLSFNMSFEENQVDPTNSPAGLQADNLEQSNDSLDEDDFIDGTRKRVSNSANWKRNRAKLALDQGLAHLNVKNQPIPARQMKKRCHDFCRYKCHTKLTEEARKVIFSEFWNLKSKIRQWDLIKELTSVSEPPKHNNPLGPKRMVTRKYYFKVGNQRVQVCRRMFLNTLDIGESWYRTATKKMGDGHTISPDKRGRHSKVNQVARAGIIDHVKEHIRTFKKVPSHFCRAQSKRKYLDGNLSIKKMYKLYLVWIKKWHPNEKTCSERAYRDVFCTNFNLSFYKPKKDQCQQCSVYNMCTVAEKQQMQMGYEKHIKNKTESREEKARDKEYARFNSQCCFAIFDLQRNFNIPCADISALYYSQKITLHNFTIYDGIKMQGFCYVWSDDEGKKGSNEIASALLDFIDMKAQEGIKEFRFWSDNCSGQNKNQNVFAMYTHASSKYDVKIYHGYLETGHTQNEADSVHSDIERASRGKTVFTPDEWYSIIETSKQEGHPYIVKRIRNRILNIDALSKIYQDWKIPGARWLEVNQLYVNPQKPGRIFVKYSHTQQNYVELKVSKAVRGRPINLGEFNFPLAYEEPLQLKQNKLKSLAKLCKKLIIPSNKQAYYRGLRGMPELSLPEELEENLESSDEDDPAANENHGGDENPDEPDSEDGDDEDPVWSLGGENGVEIDYEAWLRNLRSNT